MILYPQITQISVRGLDRSRRNARLGRVAFLPDYACSNTNIEICLNLRIFSFSGTVVNR